MENILEFWGDCEIKTSLSLEELASEISKKIFGGIPFTYGERSIWEEIPSMYIDKSIMGMLVILGGYGGNEGYNLRVEPYGEYSRYISRHRLNENFSHTKIDNYLYHLLSHAFFNDNLVVIKKLNASEGE